jgi:hypothetical protein
VRVPGLRQQRLQVARFVELAALDHRRRPEHVLHRFAQPLAAVDHAQHPLGDHQPPLQQILQ